MNYYRMKLETVPFGEPGQMLKYADLLVLLLQSAIPGKGIKRKEMKLRIRMQHRILQDDADGEEYTHFTEQGYKLLKILGDNYLWGTAQEQFDTFLDCLNACEMVDREEIPEVITAHAVELVTG